MSNPYGPPIESLEDWNAVLTSGCCCEMPSCPVPLKVCHSVSGTADSVTTTEPEDPEATTGEWAGFARPAGADEDPLPSIYRVLVETTPETKYDGFAGYYNVVDTNFVSWGESTWVMAGAGGGVQDGLDLQWDGTNCIFIGGGSGSSIPSSGWTSISGGSCERTVSTQTINGGVDEAVYGTRTTASCPGPWTVAYIEWADIRRYIDQQEFTLSDPITLAELVAAALADMPVEWPDPATGFSCDASITHNWPLIGDLTWGDCGDPPTEASATASATKVKVQWQVPVTHAGTFFQVWFDVIEEPEGWEEEGGPARSWYAQDVTREWEGPGTGPQSDPSWLMGDPYIIPAPTVPGTRRIVNVRFQCYRSPYGNKPQTTGEGIELPAP